MENRRLSENLGENFIVTDNIYNALNPNTFGNFEVSTILINTAFGSGGVDDQTFEDLKKQSTDYSTAFGK